MHRHVVQAAERALQVFERAIGLSATAVRPEAFEEFPGVSHLFYGDPELMPPPRVHGPQLAGAFGNLGPSAGWALVWERPDRLLPKGSFKGIRVVAPIAVEQPQRGIKQKLSKLFAFHGCFRTSHCSLAMVIQVLFQSCEFLFVMVVRPKRTKSFRHEDLIVAGRAELLRQPH